MTTTTIPLDIVCPNWCATEPQHHVDELWNMGGHCIHHSPGFTVTDSGRGPGVDWLDPAKPGNPIDVSWSAQTSPDGQEDASPMFWVDGCEYSIEHVLALRDAITSAVEAYRAAGGLA